MPTEAQPKKQTYTEWRDRGESLVDNHRNAKWQLGDWLLEAEYNEIEAEVMQDLGRDYKHWISRAAEHYHYKPDTFLEFRRVAKIFPKPTRIGDLSWNHHRVVAAIEDSNERAKWLDKALKKGWSVGELRTRLTDASEPSGEPSIYDFTKAEQQKLRNIARQTNLSEQRVIRLMVRQFLLRGDVTHFIDLNKTPAKRESYMTELRAKNGGKLKRFRSARIAA